MKTFLTRLGVRARLGNRILGGKGRCREDQKEEEACSHWSDFRRREMNAKRCEGLAEEV